jgi:hypothetical protein
MDKSLKYILYIILAVCVIGFIWTILGNNDIKDIRNDLRQARKSADSALTALQQSKDRVDSIRSDMDFLKRYVSHIQKSVEASDKEKLLVEEQSAKRRNEIKAEIAAARRDLVADSLPEIDELPLNH